MPVRPNRRFSPPDLAEFHRERLLDRAGGAVVPSAPHRDRHAPLTLTYTSGVTLGTTAGTRLYSPRGGELIGVRVAVSGTAPTGTLVCDVLLNGNSIFSANQKPYIQNGQQAGPTFNVPDQINFSPDDYFQIKLTTVASAGGPLVAQLDYWPAEG